MERVYRYDGTVAGLLTTLAHILPRQGIPADIRIEPPPQQGLFAEITEIATDEAIADEFWGRLVRRLPASAIRHLRLVFQADCSGREMLICRYLLLVWQSAGDSSGMLAHPQVAPLWKLAQQVGREAHRYLGFVRFQEVAGGFYYAAISPDHRVLPLIAPHFAARFRDQDWVIHDVRHHEGLVYDRHRRQWLILPMEVAGGPDLTPAEERFQALWRSYFATLAIKERENLLLQRNKVPLKARPWLVEFA